MAQLHSEEVMTRVGPIQVRRGGKSEGDAEPVVYLHSAQGEGDGLAFLSALADHVEVIAPMFPGYGDSSGIEAIDDIEDAAFHLRDLWNALGIESPTIVGLSLGGWLALELVTRWPERASRLVLVNPVGLFIEDADIKDIFGRTPGEMAEDLFADQNHPMAQMMHALDAASNDAALTTEIPFDLIKPYLQTMAATARVGWDPYLHNPKLRRRLGDVTMPTLVVRGDQDTLVPAIHAETYVAEIADSRLEVVADTAHLLPLEAPDKLADLVLAFTQS